MINDSSFGSLYAFSGRKKQIKTEKKFFDKKNYLIRFTFRLMDIDVEKNTLFLSFHVNPCQFHRQSASIRFLFSTTDCTDYTDWLRLLKPCWAF